MTYELVSDLSAVGHRDATAGLLGHGPAAAAGRLAAVARQALLHVASLALVLPLCRAALLKQCYLLSDIQGDHSGFSLGFAYIY